MSDRPIQVGDLVQVVRWSCCGKGALGWVFRVDEFDLNQDWICKECRGTHPNSPMALGRVENLDVGAPSCWLKRIPPLDELETTKDTERLKETA